LTELNQEVELRGFEVLLGVVAVMSLMLTSFEVTHTAISLRAKHAPLFTNHCIFYFYNASHRIVVAGGDRCCALSFIQNMKY
jgi:hypothetical protein